MRRHGKLRETGKKTDNENLQKPELASFNNVGESAQNHHRYKIY